MLDLEKVNKIAERIKNSKRFDENFISNLIYRFDDSLIIERYNSLYRVEFKGQTLDHLHSKGSDEKLHDIIYYAIQNKKEQLKNSALNSL
jgi:hypothetical protein